LYDLEADIGETNNLADREPEVVRSMWRRLDSALKRMGALVPTANPAFRGASEPADPVSKADPLLDAR
jgi:hypothetical protein